MAVTIADEIRALKTSSQSSYGQGIDEGLERAAEIAERHEAGAQALMAAAYDVCALAAVNMRDISGLDQDGVPYVSEDALLYGAEVANAILSDIRALTPADALAAQARLIREAEARGLDMAASRIMVIAKSLPVQHESKERGQCTYNWARWAEGIIHALAAQHRAGAAEKEADHG